MNIFLAGASGAVGRSLIPLLTSNGHTVTGTTRSAAKANALRALGAEPVVLDGLDRAAVVAAVAAARPDAIVHQMTALAGDIDLRRFGRTFADTNRLRTEGTDNLLAAAKESGVERVVAQSFTGWPYARVGGPVKSEEDPLDPHPPAQLRTTLEAIRRLEAAVTRAGGVALRYGGFYGPGTGLAPGGDQWEMVRARKLPLVGDGAGELVLPHRGRRLGDAGGARALDAGRDYNVCDDEPAPAREWVPALARAVGAKPPRKIPRWIARLVAGEHAVAMMCEVRGASNAKAKHELGWAPAWPTWREGFPALARA